MANTVISQVVTNATASSAMTVVIAYQNYDNGAVQVVWSGLSAGNGTVRCAASLDGTNYDNLTTAAATMTVSASNKIFNITDGGYGFVKLTYAQGSNNASGIVSVYSSRKSRQ